MTYYNVQDSMYITTSGSDVGIGITNPSKKLDVSGDINVSSGNDYNINGSQVLSATTLGSSVVNSSLTSNTGDLVNDGTMSVSTGNDYQINSASVLNATTLGSSVVNSSLQNLGTQDAALNMGSQNITNAADISFTSATIGGHMIPSTNDAYDIGSAEYKIRDMYVSDNSLWVGDQHKISISGGKMKFRKRKTSTVPAAVLAAAQAANGAATSASVESAALSNAGVASLSLMKLHHWRAYMRTITDQSGATIQDIFRDNTADYAEESETNWLQSGTKCFNTVGNVGIGTQDPSALLSLHHTGEATFGLKELLRLSWSDEAFNALRGDGLKISFHTSNVNNAPGTAEAGYLGFMKGDAVDAATHSDFTLGLNNGTSVVERIRITANGNMGLGEDEPSYKLDVAGDINLTGDIYVNDVAQSFGGGSITVKESDGSPSISSVSTIEFDQSSGFVVTNPSSGVAKVALGSHWKTLQVSGQTSLSPTGQETLELIAGSNVTITTDDSSSPQAVTFASTDTNTQLTQEQVEDYINDLIVAGSNITKTYDDAAGTLTIAASGGGSSVWSEASGAAYYTGNVGIGTDNPSLNLHIYEGTTSTANKMRFSGIDSAATGADIGYDTINNFEIRNSENTEMEFFTNNIERMVIDENGNVGIGTTDPQALFEIKGNAPRMIINSADQQDSSIDFFNRDGNNYSNWADRTILGEIRFMVEEAVSGDTGDDYDIAKTFCSIQGRIHSDNGGTSGGHLQGGIGIYTNDGNGSSSGTAGNNLTEKICIDYQGKMGIGTSDPEALLHISAGVSGDCVLFLQSDISNTSGQEGDNPYILFGQDSQTLSNAKASIGKGYNSDNNLFLSNGDGDIVFYTDGSTWSDGTERMRIDRTSGDVSISGGLNVSGNSGFSGNICSFVGEINSSAATSKMFAYGNGSSSIDGATMPAAGKVIAITISSTTNTHCIIELYKNGSATNKKLTVGSWSGGGGPGDGGTVLGGKSGSTTSTNYSFSAGDRLALMNQSGDAAPVSLGYPVATFFVKFT